MLRFLFLIFLFWLGYILVRTFFGLLAFSRNLKKFANQGHKSQSRQDYTQKKDDFYPDENVVDAEFKEV